MNVAGSDYHDASSRSLGDGRLVMLHNPYAVDGRVSWHLPTAAGYAPMNCYLLREGTNALLVDTGLTVHEEALLAQLDHFLGADDRLDVLVLRQGEFDSMCNLIPIVRRFGVTTVYGQFEDALRWADFRTEFDVTPRADPVVNAVRTEVVPRTHIHQLAADGSRPLELFRPKLRLLSTHWLYDPGAKALLTSDSFGHALRPDRSGPWTLTEADDHVTADDVRDHLATTRYWWLQGSDVEDVRRDLADIYDRYEIEVIAPAFGLALVGRSVTARHFDLMDRAIAELGQRAPAAR